MNHLSGELAQLGERLLCTQEVSGWIPLFSTILMGIVKKRVRSLITVFNKKIVIRLF